MLCIRAYTLQHHYYDGLIVYLISSKIFFFKKVNNTSSHVIIAIGRLFFEPTINSHYKSWSLKKKNSKYIGLVNACVWVHVRAWWNSTGCQSNHVVIEKKITCKYMHAPFSLISKISHNSWAWIPSCWHFFCNEVKKI